MTDKQCIAAIMGFVVADALGVPAEFKAREEMKQNPVEDMLGFGTHHQPAGTWSDDSGMMAATLEWFAERSDPEPDYGALMEKFTGWLLEGKYTAHGVNFDCGISTSRAIIDYSKGTVPLKCGRSSEYDNGNGCLMRILPAALWYGNKLCESFDSAHYIYELSALTHGHIRSKIGCLIYSVIVAEMLKGEKTQKETILKDSIRRSRDYLDRSGEEKVQAQYYYRLWDLEKLKHTPEEEIRSSGYVVDTLEAAVWCFLNTECYRDCVLKAVNLGGDTDTVSAVAGGLAGLYYGYEDIPGKWLEMIPKREWLEELSGTFMAAKNRTETDGKTGTDVQIRQQKLYSFIETYVKAHHMPQTSRALAFAVQMHEGQFRKGKERVPYICHPLQVACHALALGFTDDHLVAAALLHDVCEDCGVSEEELPVNAITAETVMLLTKPEEDFDQQSYYSRIARNPVACVVKLLDRCSNLSEMSGGFSKTRMMQYIEETERYVFDLLEQVKNIRSEYADRLFVLEYHMKSIIQTVRNLI